MKDARDFEKCFQGMENRLRDVESETQDETRRRFHVTESSPKEAIRELG